jgi:HSP20 family molecular chaperone IbpA
MTYYPERTLFDDFFNGFNGNGLMRTDITKKDGMYTLAVELPGYKKEDVKISLFNGELKISAVRNETKEEKDAKGDLVRSERYNGTVSRSFYVGDTIRESDIHASYDNGILTVTVPSAEKKEAESRKYISIE